MLTSAIRHHTILHHPLIGFEYQGKVLNEQDLISHGISFVETSKRVTLGRLISMGESARSRYHHVGYVVSHEKQLADIAEGKIENIERIRDDQSEIDCLERVK